jgi:hypothetical protein
MNPTYVRVYLLSSKVETWMDPLNAILLYLRDEAEVKEVAGPHREVVEAIIKKIDSLRAQTPSEELKNIILEKNAKLESEYMELRDKFDALQSYIYEAIIKLVKQYGRAVSYDEIIGYIKIKRPDLKAETITRRIRELRERGSLIEPSKGHFFIRTLREEASQHPEL